MRVFGLFCAFAAIAAPAAAQDKGDLAVIGELVFFTCSPCHVVGEGKPAKTHPTHGPHLNNLYGRRPGSLPDFEYSEAMVAFGQDKVWDEATLTTFLHDPPGVVAGTKMAFHGLKKDEELQALLAYLATFDPDGMAPN
jgi:cytochrome c